MGLTSCLPIAAMVTVECTDVLLAVITKAALTKGMNKFVSVVYYNALGTLLLLPHFLFHRNKGSPLTLSLIWRFFLLSLIGSSGQILYFIGLNYSSPTLSSAMGNLVPIYTFLLAVIFRIERLDLRRSSSQAKTLGAVIAVTGAFIVTLYRGPLLLTASSTAESPDHPQMLFSQQSEWLIGGLLLALVCIFSAIWNVAQAATVKEYPEEMTIVFFFTFFVTIQALFFSVILENNLDEWKLNTSIEITAIVCTAIFGSVFRIGIHTWCLREKGPVYVAMFRPLGMAIAVVLTVIFLGYSLYLGSVIGSIIIALGFYSVLWGQMKEKQNMVLDFEDCSFRSASQSAPLLLQSSGDV